MDGLRGWVLRRSRYAGYKFSVAGFWPKLVVLASLSLPSVIVGATFYKWTSGCTWSKALFQIYGVLYRVPGISLCKESTIASTIVLNVTFLFGVFIFALLLGTIGEEIKSQFKYIRFGNRELQHAGHVVIANWNSFTVPLVRQLSAAYNDKGSIFYKQPIVILAEKNKAWMDEYLKEHVKTRVEVHVRSGRPYKDKDLRLVSASKASTMIVLHPEDMTSATTGDALVTATVMGLLTLEADAAATNVVVQLSGQMPPEGHFLNVLQNAAADSKAKIGVVEFADTNILRSWRKQLCSLEWLLFTGR